MDKHIRLENVRQAISNVKHPAIDYSLIKLGMVKDIILKDKNVTLRLLVPFIEIPERIKNHLIDSLRQPISNIGFNLDVNVETMNQEERERFLAMEQRNWKGLQK